MTATIAGRTAIRGRKTPGSIVRSRPTASRRWRRTKRASAAPSSKPSPTTMRLVVAIGGRAGRGGHGLREGQGRGERVARAALGVERQRRLADRRACPHDQDQQHEHPEDRHRHHEQWRPLERRDAHGDREDQLRDGDAREHVPRSPHRSPQPQPPAMTDEPGPQRRQRGIERCAEAGGIGRDDRRPGPDPRPAGDRPRTTDAERPRHQVSSSMGDGALGRCRRRRHLRVGATNWTARTTSTIAATSIAATARGQNVSRSMPNA